MDLPDCLDDKGVMRREFGFEVAMRREALEEMGLELTARHEFSRWVAVISIIAIFLL